MQKDANLVELEKCGQTHILLQKFVLIQPRTSLPRKCLYFAKNCEVLPILLILTMRRRQLSRILAAEHAEAERRVADGRHAELGAGLEQPGLDGQRREERELHLVKDTIE